MTNLECSVRSCLYQDSARCCKGDIKVGGEKASEPRETSCNSFKERARNVYSNVSGQPSQKIAVKCDAVHCTFNNDQKCKANKIGIGGSNASQSEETECTSFRVS